MTAPRELRTLLVANRGEIAVRVIRTARAMGLRTVAVYSDADRDGPWVDAAELAVPLGGVAASESYLDAEKLVAAARRAGADAVHPGYGFLSENAAFAERCAEAGLVFVGPPPAAIRVMGDKAEARRAMLAAGVPCVPGAIPRAQTPDALAAAAAEVGYPVLVKAAAGGGGRGMRVVRAPAQLRAAFASARSEAESAFGNGDLLLERYVEDARHVEIQVFADAHGNVVHLGERECSVQRRHQKIVEESPSPAVTTVLRERMTGVAVAAARAVGYVGAGTVELLLAPSGEFWFMEMNTRLQVEHPVTELVTGLDLVEWQLRVAMGEPLPLGQDEVRFAGHAIEARLYAEDPAAGFLPQSGRLLRFRVPAGRPGVRIDAGVREGGVVSAAYDPMIAKVVAHGATREEARRRLVAALEDVVALGPATNRRFLAELLDSPEFREARIATDTLDARLRDAPPSRAPAPAWLWALAALVRCLPGAAADPWRSAGDPEASVALRDEAGAERRVRLRWERGRCRVAVGDDACELTLLSARPDGVRCVVDGVAFDAVCAVEGEAVQLQARGLEARFEEVVPRGAAAAPEAGDGALRTPIAGRVVGVLASAGERVRRGDPVVVVEAMKMEHTLAAPFEGVVAEIRAAVGDQVAAKAVLAVLAEAEAVPESAGARDAAAG